MIRGNDCRTQFVIFRVNRCNRVASRDRWKLGWFLVSALANEATVYFRIGGEVKTALKRFFADEAELHSLFPRCSELVKFLRRETQASERSFYDIWKEHSRQYYGTRRGGVQAVGEGNREYNLFYLAMGFFHDPPFAEQQQVGAVSS